MDKKEHLKLFNNYYLLFSREISEDLRKLKDIEGAVEKYRKVCRMVSKYKPQELNMREHYNVGELWTEMGCSTVFKEFSEKVLQLEKTKKELVKMDEVKKDIEKRENWKPISETNDQSNLNRNEESYYCDECNEEKKGQYLYHQSKNDNHKFCSTNCYQEYYGEYCSKCVNENKNFTKYLNVIPDGDSNYCRTCYQLAKQEKKEEEEQEVRSCKFCPTKLVKEGNLKYSLRICDKDDCLLKLDKELYPNKYSQSNCDGDNLSNKSNINNPTTTHTIERERERERDQFHSTTTITFWNHEFRTKSY